MPCSMRRASAISNSKSYGVFTESRIGRRTRRNAPKRDPDGSCADGCQKNKAGPDGSALDQVPRNGRQITAELPELLPELLPQTASDGGHLPGLQPVAAKEPEPATDGVQPTQLRSLASKGSAAAAAAPDAGAAAVALKKEGVEERLDAARPDAADASCWRRRKIATC